MAFESSDGKKFSMGSRKRAHESGLRAKQEKPEGGIMAPPEEQQMGDGEDEDPHSVVEEHGPAMATHTMHPEGGEGEHTVESEHQDGHKHHSSHASGREAHEHAMCLSGDCDHGNEQAEDGGGEEEY